MQKVYKEVQTLDTMNMHALIIDVDSEKILQKLSVVSIKSPLKSKELAKSFVVKWVLIHGNNV